MIPVCNDQACLGAQVLNERWSGIPRTTVAMPALHAPSSEHAFSLAYVCIVLSPNAMVISFEACQHMLLAGLAHSLCVPVDERHALGSSA